MTEVASRLSYTGRNYTAIVAELKAVIRETRPDLWSDFFDSNTGTALIELAGLVGDMLSYGQDLVAQELFLATCRRYESALRFAHSVGYLPRTATAALVTVRSLSFPDALTLNGGVVPKGTTLAGQNGFVYELLADATVLPGDTVARLQMVEGVSYEDIFTPVIEKNGEVVSTNGVVADGSWLVYIGDPNVPTNLWEQVDNVQFEASTTKTYDVSFDDQGRLHVRWGDGIAGKIPDQEITLRYRTTNGAAGNTPASTIRGAVRVNLSLPGTGAVSVEFENRDTDLTSSGGTQFFPSEAQGVTVASTFQAGTLANVPAQAGTVTITVSLPGGAGVIVLQDDGAGVLVVQSNTSLFTVLTTFITYSTGGWGITFNAALPVNGPITADYYAIIAGSEATATIIGAAEGGEDRESLKELKLNIPAYIRSQDRVITLQDYNDVVSRLPGIALVYTDLWLASYTANGVKVNVWADEVVSFKSEDGSRILRGTAVSYTRYVQLTADLVASVIDFLRPRTIVTVHNYIVRPPMLWVDIYLGSVVYDDRVTALKVRDDITAAVVALFQSASGFALYVSELYNAIRDVVGVKYFQIQRLALGTQELSVELQGQTAASPTVSGTLLNEIPTPGKVVITIEQTASTTIKVQDTGAGQFTVVLGVAVIVTSSIDYNTGAWSVTFSAPLIPNQQVLASYANVTEDRRRQQIVTLDGVSGVDAWPPPGTPTSNPTTPPYADGLPKRATRIGQPPVLLSTIGYSWDGVTVTVNVVTSLPHGLQLGEDALVAGIIQSPFNGRFTVTLVGGPNAFTYEFLAATDPGTPTFVAATSTLIGVLAPYAAGDILEYGEINDVRVAAAETTAHFYDEQYQYNNEIYYDSVESVSSDIRAINLRRLSFDLTTG
jgi:hypothetical protein